MKVAGKWFTARCSPARPEIVLGVIFLAIFISIVAEGENRENTQNFVLNTECPPGFRLLPGGTCQLRTLYDHYNTPEGFFGLRANLPEHRAGFTPEQIDLGRYLFFDPILSGNRELSCAHCHHPDYGFADGRPRSMGPGGDGVGPERHGGVELARAAPSLWNVGFKRRFFWDGRAANLEDQARGSLFSETEMAQTPDGLTAALNNVPTYRQLFQDAFGKDAENNISVDLVLRAIAAFESSLISINSRYDWYAHGDESALTLKEQLGHNVFRSFTTRCSDCHSPPLFTNDEIAVIGAPEPPGHSMDPGLERYSTHWQHRAAFVVPTLRNIAITAPYMHSGALTDLHDVIKFYNDGRGNAISEHDKLAIDRRVPRDPRLTKEEQIALLVFLQTLTDESMMPRIPHSVPSGLVIAQMKKR